MPFSLACVRSFRIFNIALFDLISSIIGLFYFFRWTFPRRPISFAWSWTILLVLPLSVLSHLVFGIPTMFNFYLGLSSPPLRN